MSISPACIGTLSLSGIKGLGLKTFHHLYQELGSIAAILAADYDQLSLIGVRPAICREICALSESLDKNQYKSSAVLEWSSIDTHHLLCIEDAAYPALLKEIFCPPPILYLDGNLDVYSMPAIAMVGSRNASIAGLQHAFTFARDLSLAGLCVYSGLALGVDAASHRGVLNVQGSTCAVLGTGIDLIYPKKHAALADEIRERGALVSELGLGSKPLPANFPRRNRIISGLTQGVFVVEASVKSGSLITARYALEQNREVYALPGSINNPLAMGCHSLIKQGAKLIETVDDILEDWQLNPIEKQVENEVNTPELLASISPEERSILSYMNYECVSFDLLALSTDFDVGLLTRSLISLELKGFLCTVPGGYQLVKTVTLPA